MPCASRRLFDDEASHDSGHDTDDHDPANLWMALDVQISLAEMLPEVKS